LSNEQQARCQQVGYRGYECNVDQVSRTGGCRCICAGETPRAHSIDGSTFFCLKYVMTAIFIQQHEQEEEQDE